MMLKVKVILSGRGTPSRGRKFLKNTDTAWSDACVGCMCLRCASAPSDAKKLLERSRGRGDRLRVGTLLGLVLRVGEAVRSAAVDLVLRGYLRRAQFLNYFADHRERIALVLGAVQDQEHAFGVLRPPVRVVAERAIDRALCH